MADEILLITRMRTLNKGNQALSAAWLDVLEQAFPDRPLRLLERRPRHLLQYTLAQLAATRDPIAAFDELARRLVALAPGEALAGPPPARPRIELDETIVPPARFVALRQRLNLRGRAAALGLYRDAYRRRLSAMQRAQLVVLNPAGEFFPREPQAAFYYLVEARVAQLLGRRTAIVNHTLDIADPTLRLLIPHVYRELELVGFRDDKSVDAYRAMGGEPSNVLVTPDLALTTRVRAPAARVPGTVGVAINVPEALSGRYARRWEDALEKLLARGLTVKLVSNEVPADLALYEQLSRRFPRLEIAGGGLDYERYAALLASFDVVLSSRMHTAILAMVAGTPVVPVEGASFKITGLFHELGIDGGVVQPTASDFPAEVVARTEALVARRDDAARELAPRIDAARARILAMLLPRLQAIAAPAPSRAVR